MLTDSTSTPATFENLVVDRPVISEAQAESFLTANAAAAAHRQGYAQEWTPAAFGGSPQTASAFVRWFQSHPIALHEVKPFFAWYASAGSLIGAASGSVGMPGMATAGGHPLMRLFRDGALEQALSDISMSAFGVPLTLDRVNGNVQLRVGRPGVETPPLDRPTREYADAVQTLPTLEEQGDGIKSFLGLALMVLAGSFQVLLIDEPEAFLHPAQARTLGRWLGREARRRDIQVVVSTHDRDLLLGFLDAEEDSAVSIVRIARDHTANHLRQLSATAVTESWKDPVLRYSNVLQGLFHARAVIAESDADCRFYRAVLDQLGVEEGKRAVSDDLLFVPSGGKQRVPAMARALSQLGVETFAIVDFDIFRRRDDVRDIVEALGATWSDEMDAAYVGMANVANQKALWETLKKQGVGGLPAGEAHVHGQSLLSELRARGVLVVPTGEMEDFDKSIGMHGAAWVSEMLDQGNYKTCTEARGLLRPLLA